MKLVKIIVYPIKELEKVTAKIANGNLNRALIEIMMKLGCWHKHLIIWRSIETKINTPR